MKSVFFLWLNDTTPDRFYWSKVDQAWTPNFHLAAKFNTRAEAALEMVEAEKGTKAEVILQELLVPVYTIRNK